MPKSLDVSPDRLHIKGVLDMPNIPLYSYATPFADEITARGTKQLHSILRHMILIREVETLFQSLRAKGEYNGISCTYRGPAHLSIGQEAVAVGTALALQPIDHVYGSHRSHGEFLAKCLTSLSQLDNSELNKIMSEHAEGVTLRLVEQHLGGDTIRLAENFVLFGFISEVLMRGCGFNRGMGGSMHAFFPPLGAYPNNAIVGGSAAIATGSALYKRLHGDGISVSITGDGAMGCGVTWEALNFAAMAQLDSLWQDQHGGGLPVLFLFNNNFYAMGGQTSGETMAWDRLARVGAGVSANALHAETIDGTNPLAVAEAVTRKRNLLLDGVGPALIDVECYRFSGHSTSDTNTYRTREEMQAWEKFDPIHLFSAKLIEHDLLSQAVVTEIQQQAQEQITAVLYAASQSEIAPVVDITKNPVFIGQLMHNSSAHIGETCSENSAVKTTQIKRAQQIAKKARFGRDEQGNLLSPLRAVTLRDALFETVLHHLEHDSKLIVYGEECREWGGAFGVYRGLSEQFPHHRLFNAPISEAAIVSTAIGYAMEGGSALIELMYADFIGRAGDEIFNQLAKWQAMSGGQITLPIVLRCSVGSKYGAQHSQDWTSLVSHIPGLRVLYPATPYDAKGLLASALSQNNPVVFFESQRLYDKTEVLQPSGVPEDYFHIELGKPIVRRAGTDVTLITIGPSLYPALDAAAQLDEHYNVNCEIIDLRSVVPLDYDMLIESVGKTGRVIIVSEACERGSIANTITSNLSQYCFASLKAPPLILGSPNWIVPGAELESTYFPGCDDIVDHIVRAFYPDRANGNPGIRWQDRKELAKQGL